MPFEKDTSLCACTSMFTHSQ